jgi:hypothetical protein
MLREERRLKMLVGMFGSKREEVTGGWRTLHDEELRSLYLSSCIIRMTKLGKMRWERHVVRMGR